MKTNNPWDLLSDFFDANKTADNIPSGVADNILIVWPVILQFIKKHLSSSSNKKVLDYGCGTGGFANQLYQLGFETTGIDSSLEMINKAKKAYGVKVKFLVGDTSLLSQFDSFNIITSIMTLQFIGNVEKTLSDLSKALEPNGLLIFAVHNPDYVKEKVLRFENGITVPIYIRTAKEYNNLASQYNLKPLLKKNPPFSKEFITKYPQYSNEKISEYLILGYRKGNL